ncbi:TPA: DNA internalization-related competence protein ComEC/Rec2 [Legionella pneumophila]|nr:DNA internalization-related competence protein ComEC/Rec2 [Legionella pneumophila]HAT2073783.1 DNA internalization-related competence protein ComEC/Rec2 [Legionella pneumophila]HAU1025588.1 DNA internalization-related competence protein ComEC/Rec2 [Legionella pneumophila]HAW6246769.1 DNA internalization-related competence protein ComEC/Rec2 [Legionella pneumophila]
MEIFCFLIGVLYAYTYNIYLTIAIPLLFYITPRYPIVLFFIAGCGFALIHQWIVSPKGMPDTQVITQAQLEGTIASIPMQRPNKTQFHFAIEKINNNPAQGLIQLNWYNKPPVLRAGQRWQLSVKLKKPRNFRNPGGFNYVRYLAARHIHWTGYIRYGNNKLISNQPPSFSWLTLREKIGDALTKLAPNTETAGIIEALTLNVTHHISSEHWNLFRRTGTVHLFGISGEHIALVSGIFFIVIRWIWSMSYRCCLFLPAHTIASIGGLLAALPYAFLAGFEPPVQRALIGCVLYTIYAIGKQRFTPWQIWRYALFLVLCIEPHAVFLQGFYFSFLAVACLLLTHQRWPLKNYKKTLTLQLSCLIGLMPLTLHWYSYGSINGFLANLFSIPLVSFLIVPLALMTMITSPLHWSWILMKPLAWLVALLLQGLTYVEQIAGINITWSITSVTMMLAMTAGLFLRVLLPVKPFKHLAILWIILPLFPPRTAIYPREALINILDVGQGLAVAIQTQHHVLLYDTGDSYFQGSDLGQMAIIPFFRSIGIKTIDKIVISHPDKDHKGGLNSLEKEMQINQLIVNDPYFYKRGSNCHSYPQWQWDGVSFRFLPIKESFTKKNNNSCILQVSNSAGRVLLTGDIEKAAEEYLVRNYGSQLASEILVVPHHGSKTSSSYRFLLEVNPLYAIASLGFDNRFKFPHSKTLQSMKTLDITFFRTDECGMAAIKLPASGQVHRPSCMQAN